MGKSTYEKLRIPVSRVFAILMVALILISRSAWEYELPLLGSVLFFIGVLFAAIGSLGRMWCSLYIAVWKTKVLIKNGPYSMTRNPLYFFTFIGSIGVCLATMTISIPVILILAFCAYYPLVMKEEDKKLQSIHAERFSEYKIRVPMFFPDISLFSEPNEYTVKPIVFRKHMFSAIWFIWAIGIIHLINKLHESEILPVLFELF
jgi:protein-S-isoprenylcysteine O-methyltransferase Ste14